MFFVLVKPRGLVLGTVEVPSQHLFLSQAPEHGPRWELQQSSNGKGKEREKINYWKINNELGFSYSVFYWYVGHNIGERAGDVCCLWWGRQRWKERG